MCNAALTPLPGWASGVLRVLMGCWGGALLLARKPSIVVVRARSTSPETAVILYRFQHYHAPPCHSLLQHSFVVQDPFHSPWVTDQAIPRTVKDWCKPQKEAGTSTMRLMLVERCAFSDAEELRSKTVMKMGFWLTLKRYAL